jgi:hypothetical protein
MMDFGKVLGRAWEITWRYKMLWVLGFLAGLGQTGGSTQSSYNFYEGDLDRFSYRLGESAQEFFAAISVVILGVLCLLFIIAIVIWVISVISRGGMIAAVQQVEEDGSTSFRRAWAAGAKKFWTLLGLSILSAIPMIILIIVGLVFLVLGIGVFVGLVDVAEAAPILTLVFVSVICGGFLCCGLFILMIFLEQIRIYGERAAILEDLGWIDAFKRGWQVLKENLGATIILWLIFFALGIVIFGISFVIMAAIAAPFFGLIFVDDPGLWLLGPLCFGGLLGVIVFAFIRSIVTAFTSATWTLAYREMNPTEAAPGEDDYDLLSN